MYVKSVPGTAAPVAVVSKLKPTESPLGFCPDCVIVNCGGASADAGWAGTTAKVVAGSSQNTPVAEPTKGLVKISSTVLSRAAGFEFAIGTMSTTAETDRAVCRNRHVVLCDAFVIGSFHGSARKAEIYLRGRRNGRGQVHFDRERQGGAGPDAANWRRCIDSRESGSSS